MLRLLVTLLLSAMPLAASYAREPAVNAPAPAFSGTTVNGDKVNLEAWRGQVVLVNFWATWCGPCRQELPLLDEYARGLAQNGLRVVSVTMDADNAPRSAMKKMQDVLSFSLLRHFSGDYGLIKKAVPTNYIIDRSGTLRYAKAGAFDRKTLNEVLVPLLNEPSSPATTEN